MKITESLFINRMSECPVASQGFTIEGMSRIFDHIAEYEDSSGEDLELDTVEIASRYEQVACGLDELDIGYNDNLICIWMEQGLWYGLKYL